MLAAAGTDPKCTLSSEEPSVRLDVVVRRPRFEDESLEI